MACLVAAKVFLMEPNNRANVKIFHTYKERSDEFASIFVGNMLQVGKCLPVRDYVNQLVLTE